ncbi:DMT family transporter [Nitratifractor sp.]
MPGASLLGHLFTFLTVSIWSVAFVGNKALLAYIDPIEVMLYRFLLAWAVLMLIHPHWKTIRSWKDELHFFSLGLLGIFVYFLLENFALKFTQASNVGLYMGAIPILTALLAHFFVRDEHFRPLLLVGFLLAMAGMGLILFEGRHFELRLRGDLLALAAAFTFALYSILLKRAPQGYHFLVVTRKSFLYGILLMLLYLPIHGNTLHFDALIHPVVWANLLFLGLFASGLAFILWQRGIEMIGPVVAGNYIYLVPLLTAAAGVALLDEKLTPAMLGGGALILAGLYLAQRRPATVAVTEDDIPKITPNQKD